ncbi:hypothetical protein C8Q77DRAFT_1116577 [Trametes polyzona]|nr:hypothetical protein C8Q77DRAFT_1116577 [Trametes polyzona]
MPRAGRRRHPPPVAPCNTIISRLPEAYRPPWRGCEDVPVHVRAQRSPSLHVLSRLVVDDLERYPPPTRTWSSDGHEVSAHHWRELRVHTL